MGPIADWGLIESRVTPDLLLIKKQTYQVVEVLLEYKSRIKK